MLNSYRRLIQTLGASLTLLMTLGAAPLVACAGPAGEAAALAPSPHPLHMSGLDLNLQIEQRSGPAASQYPNQGLIVRRLLPQGQWTSQGAGGPNHRVSQGQSRWHRGADARTLVETSTDVSGQPSASVFTYTFDGPGSGRWTWDINHGQALLGGTFTTSPSRPTAEQQLAPMTNAGLHVPLIIKSAQSSQLPAGSYPSAGLVLQSYAVDGTVTMQGFGPGNINSKGSFSYKRLSATTAVEETVQTSDFFTLPYTMVYTFKTPSSGTWYQFFGNGLIRFSGTFDTFKR